MVLSRTRIIRRNGIAFQVPLSNHSSYRYTITPDGNGDGWDESSADVDQPHGLSYRAYQDLRKGVRKRIEHEHSDLADATVGGLHLPGGCRILAIVENTTDLSTGYGDASLDVTENLFVGRGLVYDQSNNALWCATNSDGTTSGDPYLLTLHPDRIWNGGDVTWAGGHEFDASIDISGNVALDGDLTVDGTAAFDGTGIAFGGSAGIGLFYDPTSFAGGESITFPNGFILKWGYQALGGSASGTITFGTAFPTGAHTVVHGPMRTSAHSGGITFSNLSTTSFKWYASDTNFAGFYWIATGR